MFVFEKLEESAKTHPEKPITRFRGKELTYGEFFQKAKNLAAYFQKRGYEKGDIIALFLPNSDDFLICYYACQLGGYAVMPVNTKLTSPEVAYILEHSEAKAIIYDTAYKGLLLECSSLLEKMKDRIERGGEQTLERIMDEHALSFQKPGIGPDDTAVVFYTSETTGKPKGVMLSAGNIRAIANIWAESLEITEDDRMLISTPLFHCAASHCFSIPTIYRNGTVIIEERFSPKNTLATMEGGKATIFFGVPAMYGILLNTPEIHKTDLSTVRLFTYGAAPMPYQHIRRFKELFPDIKLQNLYGQTENSPGATTLKDDYALEKIGSVGEPLPMTEVKIVDECGNELPPGEVGEIIVKGPQVMKGYLKNEEETKKTIRNGWLYSGDLGRMDEDGLLYIVDRKKDMIIRGGENVYPVEVEEVLYEMDEVLEAAVVGIPHEIYGEVPKAFIVLKDGRQLTEEDVIAFCKKKLAKYKCPQEVAFLETLPRNASGKVLKHVLRMEN